MNWENYAIYWQIDHIVPISAFNYNSIYDEEFKMCWSLENLQPLENSVNIGKHNIIDDTCGNVELAKKFGVF